MGNPPLTPDTGDKLSTLLRLFLAYTRARSSEQRSLLEQQILALFESLGATEDTGVIKVRTEFEVMRAELRSQSPQTPRAANNAREFVTSKIHAFENIDANPRLSGPAREMLRIPLSEVANRFGYFDQEQANESLDRILDSIKQSPTSEIEGTETSRTSIAVIRAFAKNFCNIAPFCSGRRSE